MLEFPDTFEGKFSRMWIYPDALHFIRAKVHVIELLEAYVRLLTHARRPLPISMHLYITLRA